MKEEILKLKSTRSDFYWSKIINNACLYDHKKTTTSNRCNSAS